MNCPACTSSDAAPIEWGTDISSVVLRRYYPDAHECKTCGHAWSPAREAEKQRFREMGFRITRIKPSTPAPDE